MMKNFLDEPVLLILLTVAIYFFAKKLQQHSRSVLCNPLLISIVALLLFLILTGIPYADYESACQPIIFWVKPVIVALGVPLYLQLKDMRRNWIPILLSQVVACLVGISSVVLLARLFGSPECVSLSAAPKSVTMPIALEVSSHIGGAIQPLTAAAVLCAGLYGSIFGPLTVRLFRIRSLEAQGIAIGAASHAFGTAAAFDIHPAAGTYASIGLTINGILTALLTLQFLPFLL